MTQEKREEVVGLPPGVKLMHTLRGHTSRIGRIAWSPDGRLIASPSEDKTIRLWDAETGKCLHTLEGHKDEVTSVAFDQMGRTLASGSDDTTVRLWEANGGRLLRTFVGHEGSVWSVAFDRASTTLVSGSTDEIIKVWQAASGRLLHSLRGHQEFVCSVAFNPARHILASGGYDKSVRLWDVSDPPMAGVASERLLHTSVGHKGGVYSVAFDASGHTLASGSVDRTIKLWSFSDPPKAGAASWSMFRTLEGHTKAVISVAFSFDGRLLASKSIDSTVRIWSSDTGDCLCIIPEPASNLWPPGLAFHPHLPLLATVGSDPGTQRDNVIHIWELDLAVLLGQQAEPSVHHVTAKIVLVGDHSVGKSGLGYRMVYGHFKEQASSHGQQFWVLPALSEVRADGTQCEAILWDLAGQPDYRLVHALFVDDADLALAMFDASDIRDPLHGVGFWLKQLQAKQSPCPIILVGAQMDRGTSPLTLGELKDFCGQRSIAGPVLTSASTGDGVEELIDQMKLMIPWYDKPATVTTTTFKRIKDYVLGLKEADTNKQSLVTPAELRCQLEATDKDWRFTDDEMLTAVGHLENYGYVKRLRSSTGEQRILLEPERLNNLASSFVLEARRNPKGLGSLEEKRVLIGGYPFPELAGLAKADAAALLDAATLLFLDHNVCFRETDPLRMEPFLVFPELINLKKPVENDTPTVDGVAYTVSGAVENVFASLVVLLGYTQTFTRTNQWQNNARYEVGNGLVCGFRQDAERDGELDFVLYFNSNVGQPVRTLFQGLFESFLARRNLTVIRYEPVRCTNHDCGQLLDRSVVRNKTREGKTFAFCNDCGEKLALPQMEEPIQLTREVSAEVEIQRQVAGQRTRFEQAIYRLQSFVAERNVKVPACFVSYAWGIPEHERWVEKNLAMDLHKAGITVVLDRWENSRVGASVSRFVERIEKCDRVLVIGTPLYRHKYENKDTTTGYVVAAEVDMIGNRLIGTEPQKKTVLPLLLDGEKTTSFPPLLHSRVFADFRDQQSYFITAFDLILDLYGIQHTDLAVADLRDSLCTEALR